ncbi:MAG: hypothetical protein JO316_06660 [Abitibacteriaceae bacterium]|nr:hypothetical protein [Abditibacteriaceae bacterium]
MKFMRQLKNRLGIVGELFVFLGKRKLWWMIPMFVILIGFGVILILAQTTPLGPFIYTLF